MCATRPYTKGTLWRGFKDRCLAVQLTRSSVRLASSATPGETSGFKAHFADTGNGAYHSKRAGSLDIIFRRRTGVANAIELSKAACSGMLLMNEATDNAKNQHLIQCVSYREGLLLLESLQKL